MKQIIQVNYVNPKILKEKLWLLGTVKLSSMVIIF